MFVAPLAARAEDPKPAKSSTAVDLKDVGRNIGQLGKEIKAAGQKVGEGVKEGSRSKPEGKKPAAHPKAEGHHVKKAKKAEEPPAPPPSSAPVR